MPELLASGLSVCEQIGSAFGDRGNLMSFWQETADNFYPERAIFETVKTMGEDYASMLYASEPILYRRDFGNYIGSALRPWGRQWFKIRARDPRLNKRQSVQEYLETRSQMQMALLMDRKSQFSNSVRMGDHDWAAFGNAVESVEVRRDGLGLRFRNWHLKDCAWRENYDGEVDTFYRRIGTTVRNLCQQEAKGWSIPPKVKEKLEKNPNDKVEIFHVLMPMIDYDPKYKGTSKFVSLYIDQGNKWEISRKPEKVFNYAVSRWLRPSDSPYAVSPCVATALPDARSIQTMTWSVMEAGEKAVEPPMVAMSEAVLSGVDIRAGMVTWVDQAYDERTGEAVRKLDIGGDPQFGEALRQTIAGNIKEAFYLSQLFLPQGNPQMTAEEIMRRHEEFLRVAQPVIEPAESERNGNLLDVSVEMAMAAGLWGDPEDVPDELKGRDVDYTYDNPIQDAQKQSLTNAFNASMIVVKQTKELLDPGVVKHFDQTTAFREAIAGVAPPSWLVDPAEAEVMEEEENQAATATQALGEAGVVSEIAGNMQQQAA